MPLDLPPQPNFPAPIENRITQNATAVSIERATAVLKQSGYVPFAASLSYIPICMSSQNGGGGGTGIGPGGFIDEPSDARPLLSHSRQRFDADSAPMTCSTILARTNDPICFNRDSGQIVNLSETAHAAVLLIDGHRAVSDIAEIIAGSCAVDVNLVQQDLLKFLNSDAMEQVVEIRSK